MKSYQVYIGVLTVILFQLRIFLLAREKFTVGYQRGDTHNIRKGAQRRAYLPKKASTTLPLTKRCKILNQLKSITINLRLLSLEMHIF